MRRSDKKKWHKIIFGDTLDVARGRYLDIWGEYIGVKRPTVLNIRIFNIKFMMSDKRYRALLIDRVKYYYR